MPRPDPCRSRTVFRAAAAASALWLAAAAPRTAEADVATVFADLRAGVDQRIGELEPDPLMRKTVKKLRLISESLAVPKGRLPKDAKTAAKAVLGLEETLPGDQLLAPSVQKLVDDFLQAAISDQQSLDAFIRSLPLGARRTRAEKAALAVSDMLGTFDAAPTQSARMDLLRRVCSGADKGLKRAGAAKGNFVVATVDAEQFTSLAPSGSLGASGNLMTPYALTISAASGPTKRAHTKIDVSVQLLLLGPGGGILGMMENSGRISQCPGGLAECAERTTDMLHTGNLTISRIDDSYGFAAGQFEFTADDGAGNQTLVSAGAFRLRYR